MIDNILSRLGQSEKLLDEARDAVRRADEARNLALLAASDILFTLASKAEDSDQESIEAERAIAARRGKVDVADNRSTTWNGNPEHVEGDWDGEEFCSIWGHPDIWFWTSDIVCMYFADRFIWCIFSESKIIEKEEEDGDEEKKRTLH